MARIEKQDGRAHLRLVLWGPPCCGKSAGLAAIHAACEAPSRGGRVRLEEGSNTAGQVEYAFMDLPAWDGRALRLHCLTAGDSPGHGALRRRLLTETDAVLFLAELSEQRREATRAAWRELTDHFRVLQAAAAGIPVALALSDPGRSGSGDQDGGELPEILASVRGSPPSGLVEVRPARELLGLMRGLVLRAVVRALPPEGDDDAERYDRALAQHFAADPPAPTAPSPPPPWEASVAADGEPPEDDPDVVQWMQVRESDLRELERERALRRLLIDIGGLCAAAEDAAAVTRSVLVRLVMNLDAEAGWIGLPDARGGCTVHTTQGVAADTDVIQRLADSLAERAPTARAVRVEPRETMTLPGDEHGAHGLFLSFPVGRTVPAWLLLLGTRTTGFPSDVEGILPSAMAFLGLAVARVEAIEALRRLNRNLELKVAKRTEDLEHERDSLEDRVRERTRELDIARRAALESERRLHDQERREGVHQLAATLAHEMGNPLGAVRANLEFLRDGLGELDLERPPNTDLVADLREAVSDCLADAARLASLVSSQFGRVQDQRRAAFRTELGPAVREAIRLVRSVHPAALPVEARVPEHLSVGVAPGELTRWVYRLLAELVVDGDVGQAIQVEVRRDAQRVAVCITRPGTFGDRIHETVGELEQELGESGSILVRDAADGAKIELLLPPGVGEGSGRRVEEAVG